VIKLPVGWCAVLMSLEHELQDHRLHAVSDPDHADCEGGAAGCEAGQRETEVRYREALRECTGAAKQAGVKTEPTVAP
jgi:hypothetical protein